MSEQGGSWPRTLGDVTAGLAERARGEVVVRTLVSTGASSTQVVGSWMPHTVAGCAAYSPLTTSIRKSRIRVQRGPIARPLSLIQNEILAHLDSFLLGFL